MTIVPRATSSSTNAACSPQPGCSSGGPLVQVGPARNRTSTRTIRVRAIRVGTRSGAQAFLEQDAALELEPDPRGIVVAAVAAELAAALDEGAGLLGRQRRAQP